MCSKAQLSTKEKKECSSKCAMGLPGARISPYFWEHRSNQQPTYSSMPLCRAHRSNQQPSHKADCSC
ncbi:hypothetical protein Q8A67_020342 [Cirrhinus molitorella]|uniref:Uncharacterized protein n=1 Tax=Cirrhinus molitorella TaxID=172907 RepID=A0AA88TGV9_9TELE|nr:hypothetical protein Q8A67_020342 [Cirrhinus molitorella]